MLQHLFLGMVFCHVSLFSSLNLAGLPGSLAGLQGRPVSNVVRGKWPTAAMLSTAAPKENAVTWCVELWLDTGWMDPSTGASTWRAQGSRELASWKGQTLLVNYLSPLGSCGGKIHPSGMFSVWKDATTIGNTTHTTDQQDKVLKNMRSLNWMCLEFLR